MKKKLLAILQPKPCRAVYRIVLNRADQKVRLFAMSTPLKQVFLLKSMTRPPIRLGDLTTHGGYVVSASSVKAYGKNVACVGDRVSCPKPGHENCVIVEGSEHWTIFSKPVALHGHKTSCGAVLLASLDDVQHDQEGGGAEAQATAAALVRQHQARQEPTEQPHDEQGVLKDGHGNLLANTPFTIKNASGKLIRGVTDDHGRTPRIAHSHAEAFDIFIGHRDDLS
jgi:uncharacterized Zn-binding protein involved in type VI secretion